MTCDVLLKISGQGAIYIRSNSDHTSEEDESEFFPRPLEPALFNGDAVMEHLDLSVNEGTGTGY